MATQTQSSSGNLKTASTHPAQRSISRGSEQQFASKVLALSGILQTTLELNELFELFAKEIGNLVSFSGIDYQYQANGIRIELGIRATHSVMYNLVVCGEQLGDLKMYRKKPFLERELEVIENLMAGLLYPLRNALLYQKAIESAVIDPLTGVKNRASMDNAVHREVELSKRHNTPLSFILLDIDHFKAVNDTHGHLFGDQVLKAVAQSVEKSIRDSDMVFRYGGEEFLVLLTGTDTQGAQLLAERIRINIEALKITKPNSDKQVRVTASLGAACLKKGEAVTQLFQRMDGALYRAKHAGRNRTILDI